MYSQVIGYLLIGLAVDAQASITLHYFVHSSCNANTALSEYTNAAPVAENTACIASPPGTVAIYVDGIDEGCTIRTYTDASCTTNLGLSITAGMCYYQESTPILSFRAVCGSSPPEDSATVTLHLTSSATVGETVSPESSTPMDSASTADTDDGPVLTSVETVTPTVTQAAPPTDGAPIETLMPGSSGNGSGNGSNGTNWSMTQSMSAPSVGPGLQGTGGPTGSTGVGARVKMGSRMALGVVFVVESVRQYFLQG